MKILHILKEKWNVVLLIIMGILTVGIVVASIVNEKFLDIGILLILMIHIIVYMIPPEDTRLK